LCCRKQSGMPEYCSCSDSASAKTDTGSKSLDCALVSTMETYDYPENGCYMYCMYYSNYMCYMYYMHYVLYVLYVLCISHFLFCFRRMIEFDWIPDFIRAWPQKTRTVCHPSWAYPGKTSSCACSGLRHSTPPVQPVSRRTWRPQAGCWRWMQDVVRQLVGNGVVPLLTPVTWWMGGGVWLVSTSLHHSDRIIIQ
jgi:hypothetical protein